MTTYIYSKWKNNPIEMPVEFYSELDMSRYEVRKVEVFKSGRLTYASKSKSTGETRLGITPVPSIAEIKTQVEFEIKEISKQDFENIWQKATN
ncbi:DUF6881 domain-containing protein [Aliikangiella sp. IMCC44359]|uniref:DUF6881 domain-containing protein n=1 Tax=Aliikangiella sp. IMCC44359 TaxID=3459125 RepID=UPI00403AD11B